MDEAALQVSNIRKAYPGALALDDVSLTFKKGEVHALLGENGAGKSTLIKIISGHTAPDRGSITVNGYSTSSLTPSQAIARGIGTIYQDTTLAPDLTVAENMYLGRYPAKLSVIRKRELRRQARAVLESLGVDLPVDKTIRELSPSQAQFVSVAKAIAQDVSVLIMDEPTAALTEQDTELLFKLVRRLKESGTAVIYITHRLHEVFHIADAITVMRDGRVVASLTPQSTNHDQLISHIAGRQIDRVFPKRKAEPGDEVLSVQNLSGREVSDLSFSLRKGEILGVTGLLGSGSTAMARMLFGAERRTAGSVQLDGRPADITSPKRAAEHGIGYVPSDRKNQGVLLGRSVRENISLSSVKNLSLLTILNAKGEDAIVSRMIDDLKIKTPSKKQLAGRLSGGNQQKVVLSKWLASSSRILIFDEPTQGVDAGSRHEIYRLMNKLTEQGISIIVASSDIEELMGISDRILVLHEGRLLKEFQAEAGYSQEKIMRAASGAA